MEKQLEMYDVMEFLLESKYTLENIISEYEKKISKDDFFKPWYENARDHFQRKLDKTNAEIQRRENEVPPEVKIEEAVRPDINAPERPSVCGTQEACGCSGTASESPSTAEVVASEPKQPCCGS